MPYCIQCGKPVEEKDNFCHACGAVTARGKREGIPAKPSPPVTTPGIAPPSPPAAAVHPSPPPPAHPTARQMAEKRVKRRITLLEHVGIYAVVNIFLIVVWALSGAGYPWFLWVTATWGLGLALHALSYALGSRDDSSRHRRVEREMDKIRRELGLEG